MLETSDFVYGSAMWSLSIVMSECSLSGRGQGHASNFYIVDLENFVTASRSKSSVYRWYPQLVRGRFVYDTQKTMKIDSVVSWLSANVYYALPSTKPPTS